jgi:8-oxo-dGTP pyrophosphatase MutT (NUDIX family)
MQKPVHEIQKQILLKLAKNPSQRFSELKDESLENDLFNYHLQYLVKEGAIEKTDNTYKLTEKGLDKILLIDSKGKIYEGLRVAVLVYVIQDDKIILHTQTREPYKGEVTAGIAGKVNKGELIEDAGIRKVMEETGLKGTIKFIGVLRRIVNHPGGMIDDGFFHVCITTETQGDLVSENDFGTNSWVCFNEAIKYQKQNIRTGKYSVEVLERILNKDYSPFYFQEIVNLKA